MLLLEPIGYIDPDGVEWAVPKGFATDGASIPQFLWSLIGGPFEGPYRAAAVIHDLYCVTKSHPYEQVHRTFYNASITAGESPRKAWVMYQGVLRFGPSWSWPRPQQRDPACDRLQTVGDSMCAVNSSELAKGYAKNPTNQEIKGFFDELRSQGYGAEIEALQQK
ncbi:hypothetical protein SG09_38130 [Bradyrhizobium ottawaense]|uniref:DUF1353 domain-containing protein n=1 Tax=Bradyrhizobium ottawaense TaxID=931866 RepID=UPI0012A0260F|nr:DUF1353 domain-containing protein [Bradyrhizobium ottawaense]BBO04463.1 hypothetical protein SG09_38130 [Bradyrhizobium ottawaense]